MIAGSMGVNPGVKLLDNPDYPQIKEDYVRMYKTMRSLPCDVALGPHPGMYGMEAKFALIGTGPNPYVDPEGCITDIDINEALFWRTYGEQRKALATKK